MKANLFQPLKKTTKGYPGSYALFHIMAAGCIFVSCNTEINAQPPVQQKQAPNLLVIMTDEHNFRTLGCYRELLSPEQAFVWGKDINVETPNIDYLAEKGIRFTKFYASTPVCTPSRASFFSGMYPHAAGAPTNDMPMNDNVITFAEVLKQNGYKTGYAGKWHLDGDGKPQIAPKRQFGFADNRHMWNRGHWKRIQGNSSSFEIQTPETNIAGADSTSFTTDFLTNKTIEFIETNKSNPFCYVVSYPDPHGPDLVRSPYNKMFTDMNFEAPATYNRPAEEAPSWAQPEKNASINQAQYFGMVKCIDDNVGRLISALRQNKLLENTIIVFTADHGDLRAEHHRHNKGVPLEASAKIPFIVFYPEMIKAGSIINNAFNTADFAPSILGLLNQKIPAKMQGSNFSELLLHPEKQNNWTDITFSRSTNGKWIAAFTSRYKLILSTNDRPWLIDMDKDPNELTNFIDESKYKETIIHMARKLSEYAEKTNDPHLNGTKMGNDLKQILR